MKMIYGEELDLMRMTLEEIHRLEQRTGIRFIFHGSTPVAIQVPCELPGMVTLLELK